MSYRLLTARKSLENYFRLQRKEAKTVKCTEVAVRRLEFHRPYLAPLGEWCRYL
jgi:hypothetical protein